MTTPFRILERKRAGEPLEEPEILAVVRGAADGAWSDPQLGAFLMAVAIRGMNRDETRSLTLGMMQSGECWDLAAEVPEVVDKHSTGGVGDKVSLVLSPILAACGLPVAMLTGRGLGHTGGTADKLESIPGLRMDFDRRRCLALLESVGMAIGIATTEIAPADRRLYALRDQTATIDSLPLITASILSKKLATGAAALVLDVKCGDGAFLPELERARELAAQLVETTRSLGRKAAALVTDMSQPLGRWVGHTAEVLETYDCLEGRGPADLMELTYELAEEVSGLVGKRVERAALEDAVASGRAREAFESWAAAQGAEASWLAAPSFPLAPVEVPVEAQRSGTLARVTTRQLGLLLAEAGSGRTEVGGPIDHGVSLRVEARLGDEVSEGQEVARLYLRRPDEPLVRRFSECFEVADDGEAPPLLYDRL